MVSKRFVIVGLVDLFLLWMTTATHNNTNLYDAVSLGDIWQPTPPPPQDREKYVVSHEPHLRKRI